MTITTNHNGLLDVGLHLKNQSWSISIKPGLQNGVTEYMQQNNMYWNMCIV